VAGLARGVVKRVTVVVAFLLALTGGVLGGLALERYALDDEAEAASGVSDAEHERLLDTCMAAGSEDDNFQANCPYSVSLLVADVEDVGCGYVEAAEWMGWYGTTRTPAIA
jgi:hypothetical protein